MRSTKTLSPHDETIRITLVHIYREAKKNTFKIMIAGVWIDGKPTHVENIEKEILKMKHTTESINTTYDKVLALLNEALSARNFFQEAFTGTHPDAATWYQTKRDFLISLKASQQSLPTHAVTSAQVTPVNEAPIYPPQQIVYVTQPDNLLQSFVLVPITNEPPPPYSPPQPNAPLMTMPFTYPVTTAYAPSGPTLYTAPQQQPQQQQPPVLMPVYKPQNQ